MQSLEWLGMHKTEGRGLDEKNRISKIQDEEQCNHTVYLLSVCCVSISQLSTLTLLSQFSSQQCNEQDYYLYVTDEGAEAERGLVISPELHSRRESHYGLILGAPKARADLHPAIPLTLQLVPHFTGEETEAQGSPSRPWVITRGTTEAISLVMTLVP